MKTIRVIKYYDRNQIVFKGELYDELNVVIPKEIVRHSVNRNELSNDIEEQIRKQIKQELLKTINHEIF